MARKRTNGFSIDEILAEEDNTPFYNLLSRKRHRNVNFSMIRTTLTFVFHVEKTPNPLEFLVETMNSYILKETLTNCYKISVHIVNCTSKFDIRVHYISPLNDYQETLLGKFEELEQSEGYANFVEGRVKLIINQILNHDGAGKRLDSLLHYGNMNKNNLLDIETGDSYCLFYASLIAKEYMDSNLRLDREKLFRSIQLKSHVSRYYWEEKCKALMNEIHAPRNLKTYTAEEWAPKILEVFNKDDKNAYRLGFFTAENCEKPFLKLGPSTAKKNLYIFIYENHFMAVKNIIHLTKMNDTKYYCLDCESSFHEVWKHNSKCPRKCRQCCRFGPDMPCKSDGSSNKCDLCKKTFYNKLCFETHVTGKICKKFKKCDDCGIQFRVDKRHPHECFTRFCFKCKGYHRYRSCFITQLKIKDPEKYRIVSYDFESTQLGENEIKTHNVNFIAAHQFCTECIGNGSWDSETFVCEICGKDRYRTWSSPNGDKPLEQFINWLLFEQNNNYRTIALAHYAGRYDLILILAELYNIPCVHISCTRSGNKFFQVSVKKGLFQADVVFRDTYNFMPMALDNLVKTFNLPVNPKPFFPHLFNDPKNYNVRLSHLPPKETYCYEAMSPSKQREFLDYYEDNFNTPFYLPEMLSSYCRNDVSILSHAIVKFRENFLKITGLDCFVNTSTAPSLCMADFRTNHLIENQLAIVPENGYEAYKNASKIANIYFMYLNEHEGLDIQYSESVEGEKLIDGYRVDGFMGNTIYEMDGCSYHGCSTCYDPDTLLHTGVINDEAIKATTARKKIFIDLGYEVVTIKECEIYEKMDKNPEMKNFFDNAIVGGPFRFRDAFMGGRTQPAACYAESNENEQIVYKDIVSLYPFVNYSTSYPVGTPKIYKFDDPNVNWSSEQDNIYTGLLRCFVIPPQDLEVPVLPLRVNNRLLFTLCKRCGEKFTKRNTRMVKYKCSHDENQRGFITTTTHIELNLALQMGYKCTKLYTVYHYEEWSSEVFKDYVIKYLKLKVTSSGWPVECQTDEEKEAYLDAYRDKFNIYIKAEEIEKNQGLRFISKLCLNSLWGRFSLRNNLSQTIVTRKVSMVHQMLNNKRIIVTDIDWLNDFTVMVVFKSKEPFITEHDTSNILVSLWTTSVARTILYNYMSTVQQTPGCSLLYTDTDSVIYKCRRGADPLPEGMFLGEMSNEYPNHEIKTFVSAGAKQYGLEAVNLKTNEKSYVLKIRGITLNSETMKILQFDTFKNMVLNYDPENHGVVLKNNSIIPSRFGKVISKETTKKYRPFFDKGIVLLPSLKIVPFGFKC